MNTTIGCLSLVRYLWKKGLMAHQWIINVIADLQSYAAANDMPSLAAHLEHTAIIATAEVAAAAGGSSSPMGATCSAPTTHMQTPALVTTAERPLHFRPPIDA
jgi:hypothetical protein